MIKISKQVTIEISGEDVQTLSSICTSMRLYFEGQGFRNRDIGDARSYAGYTPQEIDRMMKMADKVFNEA